ncbi:putative RNA-directed DNA polymerase from transposon X-element [Lucilia cuprina]|nr:putative RNA-directed DNA polymerase from transposon X-element [Lucilia cuprina]
MYTWFGNISIKIIIYVLYDNSRELHERINKVLMDAINMTIPKYGNKDRLNHIVTPIIKKLQSEKSKMLTAIKKHNRLEYLLLPEELSYAKNRLRLIRKLIQDNFINSINDNIRQKLSKLSTKDPSHMFSTLRKQFRKQTSVELLKISPSDVNLLLNANIDPQTLQTDQENNFIIQNNEKQNLCMQKLSTQITTLKHKPMTISSREWIKSFRCERILRTKDNLLYIFSKLKPKLSSGIDNIILKNIPNILIYKYLTLFNNMINNAYFPESWKHAKIVIIPKKEKDISDPKNFRAISLLLNISKVFEICTNNIITRNCEKYYVKNNLDSNSGTLLYMLSIYWSQT